MKRCRSRPGSQRESEVRVTPGSRKALVAGGQAEAQLLHSRSILPTPDKPLQHQ